jgi:hypothetical protein
MHRPSVQGGIFGICPLNEYLDTEGRFHRRPRFKDEGWIPTAADGSGNVCVLATRSTTRSGHPIYFCDHEQSYDATFVVASGLWQFLRFLLRREMGADYWPYERDRVLAEDPGLADVNDIPQSGRHKIRVQ